MSDIDIDLSDTDLDLLCYVTGYIDVFIPRDLEGRRMRIAKIYACVLLYFLLKAAAFDVLSSYQNGSKILSIEKPPVGRR